MADRSGNLKEKRPRALLWAWRAFNEYLYPPRCIRCKSTDVCGMDLSQTVMLYDPDGVRRSCFCADCMADFLVSVRDKCPDCGLPLCVCECSTEALRAIGVERVYSSFSYDPKSRKNSAAALIFKLKRTDNKDAVNFAAYLLAERIQKATFGDTKDLLITYAPRRRLAVRQNGGDHMRLTGILAAKLLGCDFLPLFKNNSTKEQKKKNAEERLLSAENEIKLKNRAKSEVLGRKVVIVDDIVTSGATLSACAYLLFKAGAENVVTVTLAKAKKHMAENGVAKGL